MREFIKNIKIHNLFYPLVLLSYALAMFMPMVRPGVVSSVLVCLVAVQVGFGLHKFAKAGPDISLHKTDNGLHNDELSLHNSKSGLHNFKSEDIMLFIWMVYNILSGIWCVAYGMPPSVFLGELFTTALPMCFYFCGRTDGDSGRFSVCFLLSVALTGILGIILFITGPQFYIDYLMDLDLISKADVATMRVRMHSTIGSTLMGFLPAVGMPISVRMFMESQDRKKKGLYCISFIFMLFLAFMSNQRAAMAAAIFVLIYINYLVFFTFKLFPKRILVIECILAIAAIAGFFVVFNGAFMKVYYRLVSLPGSIAQRSDQWVGAANNMKSIWLGNGLGANGHRAIGITEHLIADGGIAKLYVESGIIGSSIFLFLMILILKKGFKELKYTAPELGVILVTLIMSIGSNMMSFALSVPVFYYYMGRAVRERRDS